MRLDFEVDPSLTLRSLRHGPGDPTIRFEPAAWWRASRTPEGPATLRLSHAAGAWRVMAWGPGAGHALESLPRLLGADDEPERLTLGPGPLRDLAHRLRGLRFGATDDLMAALVPAIIEQKVSGTEAQRSYRSLLATYGEPAPGPGGLRLPPDPAILARLAYHELHPLGLEQRRAATLIRAAGRAAWLEAALPHGGSATGERLRAMPGIGPWTAAETIRVVLGDPDAVSVGDYHTPDLVAWALAGEPRGDDRRMLELLEPYRGQRARLVRLLELGAARPPRFGPRMALRSIAHR